MGAGDGAGTLDRKEARLIIGASSLGTIFEWYDFFIYGTLAPIIGRVFFPANSEVAQLLLALAGFAVGFGVRPLGAIIFGYFGDRLGRKYTFLATITLMGLATAAVGIVPSAAHIGFAAPVILILLRVLQGLALGGEYGGAAVYVSEHAPEGQRGFYTSFIQASVPAGFVLSIIVVLSSKLIVGSAEEWDAWGWRTPFLFSLALLAFSLWMRLKLSESPVFQALKQAGEVARNPIAETFRYRGNKKRLLVALFGISAGLTVVWYTCNFQVLTFLIGALKVDPTLAQVIVGGGTLVGLFWFVLFGALSDRVGRKRPIVIGYAAFLLIIFPIFHLIGSAGNSALAEAAERAPILVSGPNCRYEPFAKVQPTPCGRLMADLAGRSIPYETRQAGTPGLTIGGASIGLDPRAIDAALAKHGYLFKAVRPGGREIAIIILCILMLSAASGATFGPVAATLSELFPAHIRYSSLSIPYHIGTGYFGGFLPLVSEYIVAKTGDPYAGLWYSFAVTLMALVVTLIWLPETAGRDLDDQDAGR